MFNLATSTVKCHESQLLNFKSLKKNFKIYFFFEMSKSNDFKEFLNRVKKVRRVSDRRNTILLYSKYVI